MSLLSEYAITPDVFDKQSYSSDEVLSAHFSDIKQSLLEECLIRNLHNTLAGSGLYI